MWKLHGNFALFNTPDYLAYDGHQKVLKTQLNCLMCSMRYPRATPACSSQCCYGRSHSESKSQQFSLTSDDDVLYTCKLSLSTVDTSADFKPKRRAILQTILQAATPADSQRRFPSDEFQAILQLIPNEIRTDMPSDTPGDVPPPMVHTMEATARQYSASD